MSSAPAAAEPAHVLVVDDDARLRELLKKYLGDNGFRVTTAGDADEAMLRLAAVAFDLIVLDVMMPGENGLDLTRRLRAGSDVPILLLTALGEAQDRITGLESGADDYLPKPFEPRELLLRLRTILRRAPPPREAPAEIRFGGFRFDLARDELWQGSELVRLTTVELALLRVLAENAGRTLSRTELLGLSKMAGNERTVDVQVTRLRRKIEDDTREPRYLQTVRGTGYMLRPD